MKLLRYVLFVIYALVAFPCVVSAQSIAIKNARIITVSGATIEHGTIVVENGKIKAVGEYIPIPSDARVIDGAGKVVMPGIVDANARFGIPGDDNEQASEVTPEIRATDLFDPFSAEVKRALQGGVTTACITPGAGNTIGGLCGAVKTARNGHRTVLRDGLAERAALGMDVFRQNSGFRTSGSDALTNIYTRRPNSRMGAVWELRHALFEARKSPSLTRVLKGELPLRVHARVENDIRVMMTIADEFKLSHVILDDGIEAYKVADLIAAHRFPVVLGPITDPQSEQSEGSDSCLNTAGILAARGLKVAFGSNGGDPARLLFWAGIAVRSGLSRDDALKAITLNAAAIAGVGDRVGSIQPGKDGDFIILNGDPLDVTARIEMVVVNGVVAYEKR